MVHDCCEMFIVPWDGLNVLGFILNPNVKLGLLQYSRCKAKYTRSGGGGRRESKAQEETIRGLGVSISNLFINPAYKVWKNYLKKELLANEM